MVNSPDILHQLSQLIWKIRISLESLGFFLKFDIRFLLIILKKGEQFFLKGVFFNKIFVYILLFSFTFFKNSFEVKGFYFSRPDI